MRIFAALPWCLCALLPLAAEAACPENEPYEICLLEMQRNNAQNDLVRVAAEQDRQEKYWRAYLAGLEQQRQAMDVWWKAYQHGLETLTARAAEAARRH